MYYVIPQVSSYGESFKVREFDTEDKLKKFLLSEKTRYLVIEGKRVTYKKVSSIILDKDKEDE